MKILMTGFDAFGGETINPALKAVQQVRAPEGVELVKLEVPTVFGKSVQVVTAAIAAEKPDVVLCIGQAGGRDAITPERVAINVMDCTAPDNIGQNPVDEPILPGGENALFATVPIKKMVAAVRQAGVPAKVSNTAGTFVCNQLLYGVLYYCAGHCPATRAGFVHVPFLPQQTIGRPGMPSMPLEDIVTGLETILASLTED